MNAAGQLVDMFTTAVEESATIPELKQLLHAITEDPVEDMMIIAKGIQLEPDDGKLGDWDVQDGDELGLYLRR